MMLRSNPTRFRETRWSTGREIGARSTIKSSLMSRPAAIWSFSAETEADDPYAATNTVILDQAVALG